MQMRFGNQGELTDYTIQVYVQRGQSIVTRCRPVLRHLCVLWYKFQYFIGEAMPSGEMWNIDAVRELAMKVLETSGTTKPEDTLRFLQTQTNILYVSENKDGEMVGGNGLPMAKRERGLDPSVEGLVALMGTDMNILRGLIGTNLQAEQKTPPTNNPIDIAEITVNGDFGTNNFIVSGIRKLLSNVATLTGWYCQQMIDSDDKESREAVEKAIGTTNVKVLKTLKGESPSKYSIFLTDTMTAVERQQLHTQIDGMMAKGQLPAGVGYQIKDIRSYKTATAVLGYQERKARTMAMEQKQQEMQIGLQEQAELTKLKISEIQAKSQGDLIKEQEITKRQIEIEKIKAQSKDSLKTKGAIQNVVRDAHQSVLRQDETAHESLINPENNNTENTEQPQSPNQPPQQKVA